jgi:Zn-dependent metalloprotease
MIIRIASIVSCVLLLGIIGCPEFLSDDHMTTATTKSQNVFLNLNVPLPSDAVIRHNSSNGTIIHLRGENLSKDLEKEKHFRLLQSQNLFAEIAFAFLTTHRTAFKLAGPAEELAVSSVTTDDLDLKHVRFRQVSQGILVWASEIIVHLNQANQVYLVHGRYVPTPTHVDISPTFTEDAAFSIVAEDLKNKGSECRNFRSELVFFSHKNTLLLAYRILAAPSLMEGWEYFIDAETGDILERRSTIHDDRESPLPIRGKETKE